MTDAFTGTPDTAARKAGVLLLLTALTTVVAVVGRVAAGADQPTLAESLSAIANNSGLYGAGGIGRFISGITLIAGAVFLLRTWIIRERLGTPLVPFFFVASGIFTALSGACAVAIAASAPELADTVDASIPGSIEVTAFLRWVTGKIGFSAAGFALIVAARYQWKVGGTLRRISPITAVQGIAMQFIWLNSATFAHPFIGAIFFAWLLAIGGMLATGRVERHFRDMLGSASRNADANANLRAMD